MGRFDFGDYFFFFLLLCFYSPSSSARVTQCLFLLPGLNDLCRMKMTSYECCTDTRIRMYQLAGVSLQ